MAENKTKRQAPFQVSGHDPEDALKFNSHAARKGVSRGAFLKHLIKMYEASGEADQR